MLIIYPYSVSRPSDRLSVRPYLPPYYACSEGTVLIIYPPHPTMFRKSVRPSIPIMLAVKGYSADYIPTPPHLCPSYFGFNIFIRIIFIRHNIPVGAMLKPFSCRTILVIVAVVRLQ